MWVQSELHVDFRRITGVTMEPVSGTAVELAATDFDMKRLLLQGLTGTVAILAIASISAAAGRKQAARPKMLQVGAVGFKGGLISAATLHVHSIDSGTTRDYNTGIGLSAGVFFDVPLSRKLMVAFGLNYWDIQVFDERQPMMEADIGLKYVIYKPASRMAIRPGIAIGGAHLADIRDLRVSRYVTAKVFTELMFFLRGEKHAFLLEVGAFGLVNGGNNDFSVTSTPIMYLRGAVVY